MVDRLGLNASIFRRLLLSYFVVVLLTLIVVGVISSLVVENVFQAYGQNDAERTARWVAESLESDELLTDMERQETIDVIASMFDVSIWLVDAEGVVTHVSTEDRAAVGRELPARVTEQVYAGETVSSTKLANDSERRLSVVLPLYDGDDVAGAIVVHMSQERISAATAGMRESMLWIALVVLIGATGLGSYLAWSVSSPLKRLTRDAEDMAHGELNRQASVDAADEMADLGRAINRMAQRQLQLQADNQRLQVARENLMAGAAHELRTPLAAIQGYAEALEDEVIEGEEQRRKYLAKITEHCRVLKRLIHDLFELNRIESGQLAIAPRPLQFWLIADNVVGQIREPAEEVNLTMEVDLPDRLPPVLADETRLHQILTNLLQNAIKFIGSGGHIVLRARSEDDMMVIEVVDTGPGIPAADLEHIWDRFYRGGNARGTPGSGLGLAIVQTLVRLQDGQVEVESEEGVGTTFRIYLPLA